MVAVDWACDYSWHAIIALSLKALLAYALTQLNKTIGGTHNVWNANTVEPSNKSRKTGTLVVSKHFILSARYIRSRTWDWDNWDAAIRNNHVYSDALTTW